MPSCDVCHTTFTTKQAAKQHKKDTKHCVCPHCNKIASTSIALKNHDDARHCHRCPQCSSTFTNKSLLNNHQRSQRHCYCGDCDKAFGTARGLEDHMQSSRHSTEFRCCDCDREFYSAKALDQHLEDRVHHQPPTREKRGRNGLDSTKSNASKWACSKCPRTFDTEGALAQHLTSPAHRPLGKLACFAGAACPKKFQSPSAVLHHLESGACPSGIDGDKMRALITRYDTDRLITRQLPDDGRILMETGSHENSALTRTPSSLSLSSAPDGCLTPISGSLSDWYGLLSQSPTHRCPFCPPKRRPFRDAKALQQHIASPAHNEPLFSCPVMLFDDGHGGSNGVRRFKTVGGLAQHLESGACAGGAATFWKAVKYIEMRFLDMGFPLRLTQGDMR